MTFFLRLLESSVDQKPEALRDAVAAINRVAKHIQLPGIGFERDPATFADVPGSPFAYWVNERVRNLFVTLPRFDTGGRLACRTNSVDNDFRYVRLWWEPPRWALGGAWQPWAKGGAYSPHYYDVDTLVAWSDSRKSYPGFLGTENRPLERPASVQHFFRPGLTWPRRTQGGLGLRVMPAGCIFGDKGPAAFVDGDRPEHLLALLAVTTSAPFRYLVELQMSFGSYEVGVIQRTPIPSLS